MRKFFKELYARIGMETPPFFKKLSNILIWIGSLCAGSLLGDGAAELYLNANIYPEWALEPLKIGALMGFFGYAIARLPVCEPKDIKDKML